MSGDYVTSIPIQMQYASATAAQTRASTTDALIPQMFFTTPAAGTYIAIFNSDMNSNTAGAAISCSYYIAGVQQASSLRKIIPADGGTLSSGNGRAIMHINDQVVLSGAQTIEVYWSISSGTVSIAARTFMLLRVS